MTAEAHQLPVQPGTVVLGKYRVDRVIGVGGMGMVAEAFHLDFDERVAIKFLLPELLSNEEAVARFERESRVLFKIKSENVCRVIDVGKLDGPGGPKTGAPFMVMEFLDGYDLATLLEEREPMRIPRAIEYGLQACQALANAHVRGIVHRDLKPENLFIAREASGEMTLKLLDFGLSKEDGVEEGGRGRKLTGDQQVMGTPHYMSPEQWMASTAVSPAADQWALAAIIFEMLAGRPPFDGPQLANICSAIMNAPTPSLQKFRPDAPPGLDGVLRKALEKHPHARYETVGSFAVALAAFAVRPSAAAKAERTLKMLQRSEFNEEEVSGAWRNIKPPRAPSDMMATIKNPATLGKQFDIVNRVRVITSTSWQNMRQPSGSKAAIGLGIVAVLALSAAAIVTLTAPGETQPEPTSAAQQPPAPTPAPAPETADTDTVPAEVAVEPTPTSSVSAAPSASSSTSAPKPGTRVRPSVTQSSRKKKKQKPPQPPKGDSQPKSKTDIFNDR